MHISMRRIAILASSILAVAVVLSVMRFALLLAVTLALSPSANAAKSRVFTLDDVQGYWWQSCADPAVQFAIQGDKYTGDFPGEFKVRIENNSLVIEKGPGSVAFYRIVSASPRRIVLRPRDGKSPDWVLRSCAEGNGVSRGAH